MNVLKKKIYIYIYIYTKIHFWLLSTLLIK